MLRRIHLNTHTLRDNGRRPGAEEPPIAVEDRRQKGYAHQVELCQGAAAVAVVSYDPGRAAGARCRIEALHGAQIVVGDRVPGPCLVTVDGRALRANIHRPAAQRTAVLRIQHASGQQQLAHEADLLDEAGQVVARVVYRSDRPLPCGARVWVETDLAVRYLDRVGVPCLPVRAAARRRSGS